MATNNYDGLLKYKQDNGDIAVIYPKTKVANVAGAATAESVATLSNRVDSINDLGNIPNRLPYSFEGVSVVFGAYPGMDINTVSGYASLPWIHTRNHKLTGSIESPYNFYVVNLTNGSVQIVDSGATVNITAQADSPSNIIVRFIVPANLNVLTPYLVYSSKLSITISNS
jgi:hypothetical protein|nr:MAG TPA: hypothetical protein [Caudoviricetes sp.]